MANSVAAPAQEPVQAFARVLTRRDLIIYGLVILTPTAPYPVLGVIQQSSGGHATLSYLVAMVAMLFTAASYARMAVAFPVAGSTYSYVSRGLNRHAGFLAGWSMMLDYFLIPLLSVVYCALTAARLVPVVPYLVWAFLFTAIITFVNLRGITTTVFANNVLIVILSASVVLFIGLAVRFVLASNGWSGLWAKIGLYRPETFSMPSLMTGASIAALSYIGFDAVTTLAEDSRDPRRDLGFATVLVCVLQTGICALTTYLASVAWPNYRDFPLVETAILDIGARIGGGWFQNWITFVLLVAGLASALTGQAGASRLLFGMSRDGMLPRRMFAQLEATTGTPARSIWFMALLTLAGCFLAGFQLIVEMLNFGAFAGFVLVNLSVVSHYFFRNSQQQGRDLWRHLIAPGLGVVVCLYLWMSLSSAAKIAGFVWMAAGVLYLAVLTKGFRAEPKAMEV